MTATTRYALPLTPAFTHAVAGIVHLVRLRDEEAAEHLRVLLPRHACYNGVSRLYWPGFNPTQRPKEHPYKRAREVEQQGCEHVQQEYFENLAEHSLRVFAKQGEIDALERSQDEAFRKQQLDSEHQQVRRTQDDKEFEQWLKDVERQRDDFQAQKEQLEAENKRLNDELRHLRYRINQSWSASGVPEICENQSPTLYLSDKAKKCLQSFDKSEQDYWEQHIFPKLLDSQLRGQQTDRVSGKLGDAWVYPRGRTNDGRRVIFSAENKDVLIYEVLHASEHDDRYSNIRQNGVDTSTYQDFQPWTPTQEE